jgi:iron uptake system component EfeO
VRAQPVRTTRAAAILMLALLGLTACVANAPTGSTSGALTVTSTATECTVSAATAPAGTVVFTVTNGSETVTEFYLLGENEAQIMGEVENIGPGLSRDLVVTLEPGNYYTTCKPGSASTGINLSRGLGRDRGSD